ncbi:hypothetical protein LEP1GSC202_0706 [Leptospira yanagawae serovar Saopaulo str. Sao Paulo = ATCC 700523]|uniref:Uncharacterized protein n=1 Tax=Leptospira yanagawae serovar Saopaulo str. Sao Paulo = ATCC 700523 TaxID=1249483 RepID=A0A5E8HFY5_9LEPT|nr:hypothetical protein [Leptospira yanagawae]EOQ88896.1 hypothetical protein LEP1GSC202_0706 [Leptospira yanagawae serovar Saopaulo str. Sao Paulo = ATCC 700523]
MKGFYQKTGIKLSSKLAKGLLIFSLLHCNLFAPKSKNDDVLNLFLLSQLFQSKIEFQLGENLNSNSLVRNANSVIVLPAEFNNPNFELKSVPIADFSMNIAGFLVWKSPEFGGVPYGQETVSNADKILLDMGAEAYGSDAKFKVPFQFGQWDIFQSLYGVQRLGQPLKTFSIDPTWKDGSYDRLGLIIFDFKIEYDSNYISSPMQRLVEMRVRALSSNNGGNINTSEDYYRNATVTNFDMPYLGSNETILSMKTPCQTLYPDEPRIINIHQAVFCGMSLQPLLNVNADTGSAIPSAYKISSSYVRIQNGDLALGVPQGTWDTNLNELSGLPGDAVPPGSNLAVLHGNLMPEYSSNSWNNERLLVLKIPGNTTRNRMKIVVDKNNSLLFHSSNGNSIYTPITSPKLMADYKGPGVSSEYEIDDNWSVANGIFRSAWPTTASDPNQIDPSNGKVFGYFLPKISIQVE